jgi:hypothetical protein
MKKISYIFLGTLLASGIVYATQTLGPADKIRTRSMTIEGDGVTPGVNFEVNADLDMQSNAITDVGNVDGRDVSADGSSLDSHLNGGASKHDASEVDYERVDGSKKNIDAASDDLEASTTDLDDAIGSLAASPTNYTPADPTIVADHLAGIDTALGAAGGANTSLSNLTSPTSVNESLIPANDGVEDLGSGTNGWDIIYLEQNSALTTPNYITYGMANNQVAWRTFLQRTGSETTTSSAFSSTPTVTGYSAGHLFGGGSQDGDWYLGSIDGYSGEFVLATGDNTGAGLDTGGIQIATGQANDISGDITLQIGTAVTTRGTINFIDGSEGTSGECWVSTGTGGEGNWDTCPGGGGATTALDNLASVDINADLQTADDATADATPTAGLTVRTGNKTAGTGDSGDLTLKAGTSAGGNEGDILTDGSNLSFNSGMIFLTKTYNPASYWGGPVEGVFVDNAAIQASALGNSATFFGTTDHVTLGENGSELYFKSGDALSSGVATGDTGPIFILSGGLNGTNSTGNSGDIEIATGIAKLGVSGDLNLKTGNGGATTGTVNVITGSTTGTSGNIVLDSDGGTTDGSIIFRDGSQGISGECWVSKDVNGGGNWDTCPGGGGGATTALDNLSSVAINTDLAFGSAVVGRLKTANNGAGDSEDLNLETGTATGSRGSVNIGGDVDILTDTGTGFLLRDDADGFGVNFNYISPTANRTIFFPDENVNFNHSGAGAGSFSNITLSNLTSMSLSTDLVFATGNKSISTTGGSSTLKIETEDITTSNSAAMTIETGNRSTTGNGDTGTLTIQTGSNTSSGTGTNSGALQLKTGTVSNSSTGQTGNIFVQSGTAGSSSSSGNINILVGDGSAVGNITLDTDQTTADGNIIFQDGSQGTSGHCWRSTDTSGGGNWEACPGSAPTSQVFTTGGTWNKPAGLAYVKITVIGGGGGGGGVDGQGAGTFAGGGGGGAGATSVGYFSAGTLGASETVTIGSGGAGGVGSGGNNGSTGGASSFGTHVTANGGVGGVGRNAATNTNFSTGGTGGNGGTAPAYNLPGDPGHHGIGLDTGGSDCIGGAGGGKGGGRAIVNDNAGNNANGYGAGGGGAAVNDVTTNFDGGNGSGGIVIVEEYY